jgi:hypothetical protein
LDPDNISISTAGGTLGLGGLGDGLAGRTELETNPKLPQCVVDSESESKHTKKSVGRQRCEKLINANFYKKARSLYGSVHPGKPNVTFVLAITAQCPHSG